MGIYNEKYIICPECKNIIVARHKRTCNRCGIEIYFPGEFINPQSNGYFYHPKNGMIKICNLMQNQKGGDTKCQ